MVTIGSQCRGGAIDREGRRAITREELKKPGKFYPAGFRGAFDNAVRLLLLLNHEDIKELRELLVSSNRQDSGDMLVRPYYHYTTR